MAIKANVKQNKKKCAGYPKLMVSSRTGAIVLFESSKKGTCLVGKRGDKTGEYSEDWNMELFNDFDGIVTLSNKR